MSPPVRIVRINGDHDNLSRGAAERVRRRLVNNEGAIDAPPVVEHAALLDSLPPQWVDLYENAFGSERDVLVALAEAGAPRPDLGFGS